jgi:cyclopropane fatty-acyl-phospholipid synthase-like methyltransferase
MEKIYESMPLEQIPWNMEEPPDLLRDLVDSGKFKPCRAIELGCGAGNYVMYLAKKGFAATGVDFSQNAVDKANEAAVRKNVNCEFIAADVLGDLSEVRGTFDFAYDWELLHHVFPHNRETYFKNVHRILNPGAVYLSVCFSEESPQFGGRGKYRMTPLNTKLYFSSEKEITDLLAPLFDIEESKTVEVRGKFGPHKAIYVLCKKGTESR